MKVKVRRRAIIYVYFVLVAYRSFCISPLPPRGLACFLSSIARSLLIAVTTVLSYRPPQCLPKPFYFYFYFYFFKSSLLLSSSIPMYNIIVYFVGGFTLIDLVDEPCSQVSSLPPGTCLHFYRAQGSAFPLLVDFHRICIVANSRSRAFR